MQRGGRAKDLVVAAWLAAIAVFAFAPAAQAAPGDVYVSDQTAATIWRIGPGGGEATPLSTDPDLTSIYGMTMGPDGLLYVANQDGNVLRVDRASGAATEVADVGENPIDVAFDARGRLLAIDFNNGDIHVVNKSTGATNVLVNGPGTNGFNSLSPARSGAIFVANEVSDKVFRVNGSTFTPVIENDVQMTGPNGTALAPDERFLYVGSFADPRFFREDLRTGQTAKFEIGVNPYSIALLPSRRLIFSNANTSDINTVGLTGGTPADFSTDSDLMGTRDVVVEPKRCAGRFPTVVGTNARDVIKGSPFPDVISTLGGRDLVRGVGANDVICLGGGNDRGIGGKGSDRLLGQGGKDTLAGGLRRDFLIGGAGRDRLVGGAAGDVCRGGPGRDVQRAC